MSKSRKYQRYFQPISKEPFSTAGTNRSQGRVGQTSLSTSYTRTPFIGTSPVNYGDNYDNIVFSCCSSSASQGKSSKTTKGFLLSTVENPTSVYNSTCISNCNNNNIVKDFSPENNSQGVLTQRNQTKNLQQNWPELIGNAGKYYTCNSCSYPDGTPDPVKGGTSYHIGGRLVTNEPYAKRVAPMSSGEYMRTQFLYQNKTEECCT